MDLTGLIAKPKPDAFETEIGVVRGCICHNTTLKQLRALCDDDPFQVPFACQQTRCGSTCGLCIPYIQAAVQCKADELDVMWSDAFQALGIKPGRVALIEQEITNEKRQGLESPAA
jgi:bacterioferritin-associated ferredoxin